MRDKDGLKIFGTGLFFGFLIWSLILIALKATPSHIFERDHEVTCVCDTVYVGPHVP